MRFYQNTIIAVVLIMLFYCALETKSVQAQFQPPANVVLVMYRLNPDTGEILKDPVTQQRILCKKDDKNIAQSFGCTAIPGEPDYAYPFNTSTITISIDGMNGADNDQYAYPYVWDVVAQELGMNGSQGNKPLSSVKSQLIAARTYIYERMLYIDQYGTPNNSVGFHAFLPYKYATLTLAQQTRMRTAAQDRYYMSQAAGTYPIDAAYGADNLAYTRAGNRPYLQSVPDPINAVYGIDFGTPNGGMSSKGASRWGFGHTSSLGPVAIGQPNYPRDRDNLGDFWSVRWNYAEQILTHYYTGIHIRDADNLAVNTPSYRWVPLEVRWNTPNGAPPPRMTPGDAISVTLWIQNTGTLTWTANNDFYVVWDTSFGLQSSEQTTDTLALDAVEGVTPLRAVAPGDTYTATFTYVAPATPRCLPGGPYFEMVRRTNGVAQRFSQLSVTEVDSSWPMLMDITFYIGTVEQCRKSSYLPLILSDNVTQASEPEATATPVANPTATEETVSTPAATPLPTEIPLSTPSPTPTMTPTPQPATLVVRLDVQPDSIQNFQFSSTLGDFQMDDASINDGDAYGNLITYTVAAGSYQISELVPNTWYLTDVTCTTANATSDLATHQVSLTLASGEQASCTFVNQRAVSIRTRLYNDNNGSGSKDGRERWFSNGEMRLYLTDGSLGETQLTNQVGKANYNNLVPGSYTICEVLTMGWRTTQPGTLHSTYQQPCYSLTLQPAQIATVRFGNQQAALIAAQRAGQKMG